MFRGSVRVCVIMNRVLNTKGAIVGEEVANSKCSSDVVQNGRRYVA